LLVDGAPIGILRVHDSAPRAFAPEDVGLIQALADQAALAIEHARLLQRGREAAVLEERARLARELHDSVTQSIFSLSMLAQAARTQHERTSDQLGPTLERIGALAQEALFEMRSLLFELHPASLAEKGLARALDQLIASMRLRGGPTIAYGAETDARPEPEAELALLRIVQEALANAIKHAGAGEVTVTLVEVAGRLTVTVTDDGAGFDPSAPVPAAGDGRSGGMGLRSMRERAARAGVALEIVSAPGAGTTVRATAPFTTSSSAHPAPEPR
jgi:signal transduction histidine kinase